MRAGVGWALGMVAFPFTLIGGMAYYGNFDNEKKIGDFKKSFIAYEGSQSSINRDAVIKTATDVLLVRSFFEENEEDWLSVIDNAQSILIKKGDWDLVNDLYSLDFKVRTATLSYKDRFISFSPNTINLIGKYYGEEDFNSKFDRVNYAKGDYLIDAGNAELEQGNLNKAYNLFAEAGITDNDTATYAKGLAAHYGCSNLVEAWGGLTRWKKVFKGDELEPTKVTLTNSEIAKARINITKRILPTIDESCPIFNN